MFSLIYTETYFSETHTVSQRPFIQKATFTPIYIAIKKNNKRNVSMMKGNTLKFPESR